MIYNTRFSFPLKNFFSVAGFKSLTDSNLQTKQNKKGKEVQD